MFVLPLLGIASVYEMVNRNDNKTLEFGDAGKGVYYDVKNDKTFLNFKIRNILR